MRLGLTWVLILPFCGLAYASCNVTGRNPSEPPNLTDLRTPTPFTFTLSAVAEGCNTDPLTLSFSETWLINGTGFAGANPVLVTLTNALPSSFFAVITFPGITVTSLTPGEPMTLFDGSGGTGVVYTVPITAIPYTPTSTTSSYSTPTTTSVLTPSPVTPIPSPTPTSSKSTPIGGIVAGSVVGGIAIVAILVFGWYKVQRMRLQRINNATAGGYNQTQQVYPPTKPVDDGYQMSSTHPEEQFGAPLDQTVSDNNIASARLRYVD